MRNLGHAALALQLLMLHAAVETALSAPASRFQCPEGFFVFGTSIVDTGNALSSIPFFLDPENPPYGISFFGRPARRYSDGRTLIDYFSQAFKFPLSTPYLRSIGADFRRGANFAFAGSTLLITTIDQVIFYFGFQQGQFIRFKQNALQVQQQAPKVGGLVSTYAELLPSSDTFERGLYVIRFGPRNDLGSLVDGGIISFDEAKSFYVPALVSATAAGIQNLYGTGARQFLVFNANAVGCIPQTTTFYANNASLARDEFGCVGAWNEISTAYNTQLHAAVKRLRANLTDATIFLFDTHSAQREVFSSPEKFGFSRGNLLKACCGVGGDYNYDPSRPCGGTYVENDNGSTKKVEACANPAEYLNWDGVHDTEALARVYAKFALTGQYLDPPLDFSEQCNLDFSKFTGSNFMESYPDSILLI